MPARGGRGKGAATRPIVGPASSTATPRIRCGVGGCDRPSAISVGCRPARRKDTLRSVETSKHLGRVIARDDWDTPAIRRDLKRARQVLGRISKVIAKEEVQPWVAGMFYQAVVAAVLLYGSEMRCITNTVRRPLNGCLNKLGLVS